MLINFLCNLCLLLKLVLLLSLADWSNFFENSLLNFEKDCMDETEWKFQHL